MIEYHYQTAYRLPQPDKHTDWIISAAIEKGFSVGELNYIFCDDDYLLDMNRRFLGHDYLTDILTFPANGDNGIGADVFISVDRVRENAEEYGALFEEEMRRVMIHGVLHLMGGKDSTNEERDLMRAEEDTMLEMFHVKHT